MTRRLLGRELAVSSGGGDPTTITVIDDADLGEVLHGLGIDLDRRELETVTRSLPRSSA